MHTTRIDRYAQLVIGSALLCSCSAATRVDNRPIEPLAERFTIGHLLGDRDTLYYEATVQGNLALVNELDVATRQLIAVDTARAWRFFVAPAFRIRQLGDSSAAVRTPSFMPSLSLERHWLRVVDSSKTAGQDARNIHRFRDIGWRGTWAHHSNGQAGCFREGFNPTPSGNPDDCIPTAGAPPDGTRLNRANGDFSTSYWEVGGFARDVRLGHDDKESRTMEGGFFVQYHRYSLFGVQRDEQRALYGDWRIRSMGTWLCRPFSRVQSIAQLEGEYGLQVDKRITPWRASATLALRSLDLLGAGVFIKWQDGFDPYNIAFATRRTRWQFGLVLDPSGLARAN